MMSATKERRKTKIHEGNGSHKFNDRPADRPSSAMPPFNEIRESELAAAETRKGKTNQPPVERTQPTSGPDAIAIPVSRLVRHPDNRKPTPEQIADLKRRIDADGQLEPIVVRELPVGHKHRCTDAIDGSLLPDEERAFQIVSGETRVLAQIERGEEKVICRQIEDCDDPTALKLMAEFNAGRQDLNPIQKARLIKRLCESVDKGGAGMNHEQAGAVYGLESRSGAANLIRLLELPKALIELVESGKLPQTFARIALPYCAVQPIAADLTKALTRSKDEEIADREEFERDLCDLARKHTRSMEEADTWQRTYGIQNPGKHQDRLFEADANTRGQLGVVKLRVGWREEGEEERAINLKLWDRLQNDARKTLLEKAKKKSASKATKGARDDDSPAKKERTPAEQRELEKTQDAQLGKRIRIWRHEWLRELISTKLRQKVPDHWVLTKLVMWCLAQGQHWSYHSHGQLKFDKLIGEIVGEKNGSIEKVLTEKTATQQNLLELLARAIAIPEERADWQPAWPFSFVDQIAADLQIDLNAAWQMLQVGGKENERMQLFYGLHNTRQLFAVARELGIHAPPESKGGIIKVLNAVPRTLPLPKSIKPVGEKKRKAK